MQGMGIQVEWDNVAGLTLHCMAHVTCDITGERGMKQKTRQTKPGRINDNVQGLGERTYFCMIFGRKDGRRMQKEGVFLAEGDMWVLGWSCRLPFAAWLQPGLAPPGLPNRFPTLHSKYPQFGTTLNIPIFKRFKFHNLRGCKKTKVQNHQTVISDQ